MRELPIPPMIVDEDKAVELLRGVQSSRGFVVRMASVFSDPDVCAQMIIELSARIADLINDERKPVQYPDAEAVWDRLLQGLFVEIDGEAAPSGEISPGL